MFEGDPVWTYNIIDDEGFTPFNEVIMVDGDSMYQGHEYVIIKNELFRSENGIVYIITAGDSIEKVLYNFNLQIGDYFYNTVGNSNPEDSFLITQIDTFTGLDGVKRKHFFFEEGGEWIEGIGGITSLTRPKYFISLSGGLWLHCFKQFGEYIIENELSVYVGDNTWVTVNCGLGGFMSTEDIDQSHFIITPNPAKYRIKIEDLTIKDLPISVQIYNLNGLLVYTNDALSQEAIEVSKWPSGIYFVRMILDQKVEIHRLIVE